MGCDIHVCREVYTQKWVWDAQNNPYTSMFDRSYPLFAMLGGVRQLNPLIPIIHPPRGLPSDVSPEVRKHMGTLPCDQNHEHISFCYESTFHTHSWATGAELLAYDMGRLYTDESNRTLGDVIGWVDRIRKIATLRKNPDHLRIVYAFDN